MDAGRWAVETVIRCGGILEQPAGSLLWQACQLPRPDEQQQNPFFRAIYIEQGWYGFPTPKPTWLLLCGLPEIHLPPMRLLPGSAPVFTQLTRAERSRTMPELAKWLVETARKSWWQHQ
jgi:hypothetical protein